MRSPLSSRGEHNSPHERAEIVPNSDLAPVVAIGGLLTMKQLADWYTPVLDIDRESDIEARKRFLAPPKRGLGQVEEMRDELTSRLERLYTRLGQKMYLVGHSLGGLMATMAAVERPDMVAGVVSLGGVHDGIRKETFATIGLKRALGNPPQAKLIKYDSDFMEEHRERMANEWPENVPLHVVSVVADILIVPPQGFGIKLPNGRTSHDNLVIPAVPGAESLIRGRMGIPDDVRMLRGLYPAEHMNIPRVPAVVRYVRESRLALAGYSLSAEQHHLSPNAQLQPAVA